MWGDIKVSLALSAADLRVVSKISTLLVRSSTTVLLHVSFVRHASLPVSVPCRAVLRKSAGWHASDMSKQSPSPYLRLSLQYCPVFQAFIGDCVGPKHLRMHFKHLFGKTFAFCLMVVAFFHHCVNRGGH